MQISHRHLVKWLPLALATPLAAPLYAQVEDTGAHRPQAFLISGDGIHGLGQLVLDNGGGTAAHRWTSIDGIETLANPLSTLATPNAISDDGSVVVGFAYDDLIGVGQPRALRWDAAGVVIDLTPPGATSSDAFQISGDGSTCAGIYSTPTTTWHACVWDAAGALTDIHPTFGDSYSRVTGMSHDGSTVLGFAFDSAGDQRNFVWNSSTGSVELPTSSAGRILPESISADGTAIVGRVALPGLNDFGIFYWTAATGYIVSDPSLGEPSQVRISPDGNRVYGIVRLSPTNQGTALFTWTPSVGFQFDNPNMFMTLAAGSFDGSVLVGSMGATGQNAVAYRWTSATSFVPLNSNGISADATTVSHDGTVVGGFIVEDISNPRSVVWNEAGFIGASYCGPAVPNSSGVGAKIILRGSNITSFGSLTLTASDLPLNTFGMFIASNEAAFVANPGGSQGNLCLGGSSGVIRLDGPGQVFQSGPFGAAMITIDPSSFDGPTGPILPPFGERWHFQAWFRDANPTVSSNFSDGATVPLY